MHCLISLHMPTSNVLASTVDHCATVPEWLYGEGLPRTGNKCTSLVGAGVGLNSIRKGSWV